MPNYCSVPQCKGTGGFKLPLKSPNLLRAWTIAISRKIWRPSKNSVVCAEHFKPEDFISVGYYGKLLNKLAATRQGSRDSSKYKTAG